MHRFSRRASPPNTKPPRDHRTCPYVVQFHFQDRSRRASSNTSLRSLISAIENARFTCHRSQALISHAETSAGVRYSARHRRVGLDGMLQHSTSPPSPGLDHERAEDSRRANDGPLAESSQRHRGASRRRFPTTPYGGAAERARVTERAARVYSNDRPSAAGSLRRIASLLPARPARRSAVPALQQCVAAEAPRDGAGNFRLHIASMRPMPRALVEF